MRRSQSAIRGLALAVALVSSPSLAHAGKLSWLDSVVQEVVRDRAGGRGRSRFRRSQRHAPGDRTVVCP